MKKIVKIIITIPCSLFFFKRLIFSKIIVENFLNLLIKTIN